MSELRPFVAVFLGIFVVAACKTEPKKPVADTAAAQPLAAKAPGPVPAGQKRSSDVCVGPLTTAPPRSVTVAGREWEVAGSVLTEKTQDADDGMVIGVIADLKEDNADNQSNIDKFLTFFKQEKVELIFVDGDSGETKQQIAANLARVAQAGLPVGIIIGNRECKTDFNQAVEEVQKKFVHVFNLNFVRHIVADDAEFVTMPGYYNSSYLHCVKDGCQYFEEDVMALGPIVKKATRPVTVVSHGPPRQNSPTGIDRISEGTNEGDPALARFISEHKVPFGIFANIHEAGGHATDLSGDNTVKEGVVVDSFYLNPGPADSVRWTMNNSTESVGMAAVVTYKGKQASYKIHRLNAQIAKKK